jgi:uncharacterized membrane protein YcgQ (UPF0703/DUF1980 family)
MILIDFAVFALQVYDIYRRFTPPFLTILYPIVIFVVSVVTLDATAVYASGENITVVNKTATATTTLVSQVYSPNPLAYWSFLGIALAIVSFILVVFRFIDSSRSSFDLIFD